MSCLPSELFALWGRRQKWRCRHFLLGPTMAQWLGEPKLCGHRDPWLDGGFTTYCPFCVWGRVPDHKTQWRQHYRGWGNDGFKMWTEQRVNKWKFFFLMSFWWLSEHDQLWYSVLLYSPGISRDTSGPHLSLQWEGQGLMRALCFVAS